MKKGKRKISLIVAIFMLLNIVFSVPAFAEGESPETLEAQRLKTVYDTAAKFVNLQRLKYATPDAINEANITTNNSMDQRVEDILKEVEYNIDGPSGSYLDWLQLGFSILQCLSTGLAAIKSPDAGISASPGMTGTGVASSAGYYAFNIALCAINLKTHSSQGKSVEKALGELMRMIQTHMNQILKALNTVQKHIITALSDVSKYIELYAGLTEYEKTINKFSKKDSTVFDYSGGYYGWYENLQDTEKKFTPYTSMNDIEYTMTASGEKCISDKQVLNDEYFQRLHGQALYIERLYNWICRRLRW